MTAPVSTAPTQRQPVDQGMPWNMPGPSRPLPGAVAQASVKFATNFMAGGWVDLFAVGPHLGPQYGWASFGDAVKAAREITKDGGSLGIFQSFDHGMQRGFFAQKLQAVDMRSIDQDPATSNRVDFDPRAWENTHPNKGEVMPRITTGITALDVTFRGVVAGEILPTTGPLG